MRLLEPDDFAGDPYGWLTNQLSHWALGLLAAWALLALGAGAGWTLAAIAAAMCLWEARQLRLGGGLADGAADWGFVMLGAIWGLGVTGWLPLVLLAVALAAGVALRLR